MTSDGVKGKRKCMLFVSWARVLSRSYT